MLCSVLILVCPSLSLIVIHTRTQTPLVSPGKISTVSAKNGGEQMASEWLKPPTMVPTTSLSLSLSLPHSSTAFSLSTCPLPRSRPATPKPFQCQSHSSCQRGSGSVEAPRHHTKSAKRRKRGGRTGEKKKRGGEEDAGVRLFYFSNCLRFPPPCVIFSPSIFGSLHCLQQLEITKQPKRSLSRTWSFAP